MDCDFRFEIWVTCVRILWMADMKGVLEETYTIFWVEEEARGEGIAGWWSGLFCMRESTQLR